MATSMKNDAGRSPEPPGRPAGWPEIVPRFLHPRMFLECFHRSRLAGRPANSSIGLLLKKELIVLNAKQLRDVVRVYESIKTNYSTMVSTTSQYIVDLRNELNETKLEVASKSIEIANKNTDVATLTGQVEILKLQIENARLKAEKAPNNKIKNNNISVLT